MKAPHMHRADIRQVAAERVEDFALAGNARHQDMVLRHARDDAVIDRVATHADALGNEDVLGAAVGRVSGELAERAFRLVHTGEDFALDDDLGRRRHLEIGDAAARQPIRLAEQPADDLELPHVLRIGIDHRAHVMQRMDAERDRHRQVLALLLRAAMKLVHASPRMQRYAQPVLVLQHQPVKARGVDTGDGIARAELAGGDVRGRIDGELQRDREQLGQIDVVAFDDHLVPGRVLHHLAGDILLAALAKRPRQLGERNAEACREKLAVAGRVGQHRHLVALDVFEQHDRAAPGLVELEHHRRGFELEIDRIADAQQLLGIVGLDHPQKAAQALIVDVRKRAHAVSHSRKHHLIVSHRRMASENRPPRRMPVHRTT
jgi:hypothetical protein